MPAPQPEPWLRVTHTDVPVVHRAVLHALEQAGEDIDAWCGQLTMEELTQRPALLPSVMFHIEHIARSLDRLMTYAEGNPLSKEQLETLSQEGKGFPSREEILTEFKAALVRAIERLHGLEDVDLAVPRGLGRASIPTSVGGILIHIAEHTQRHVGQAITTAKLLLAQRQF